MAVILLPRTKTAQIRFTRRPSRQPHFLRQLIALERLHSGCSHGWGMIHAYMIAAKYPAIAKAIELEIKNGAVPDASTVRQEVLLDRKLREMRLQKVKLGEPNPLLN